LVLRQRTHRILLLRPQYYQTSFSIKSVSLTWKDGNRMVPSPDCKPDVLATSLHRIPLASVAFFWKYEAWYYLAGITHGFCWLMWGIFVLKLCTFDLIVHSIIYIQYRSKVFDNFIFLTHNADAPGLKVVWYLITVYVVLGHDLHFPYKHLFKKNHLVTYLLETNHTLTNIKLNRTNGPFLNLRRSKILQILFLSKDTSNNENTIFCFL